MNRLTQEQAERIRAKANAALGAPVEDTLAERLIALRDQNAALKEEVAEFREALWFYETWVSWLEGRLRLEGIDPNDMWDDPPAENA